MTDKELFLLAKSVRDKAYAPYSKFNVGAALLAKRVYIHRVDIFFTCWRNADDLS